MQRKRYPLCYEGYTQASTWSKFPQDGKLTYSKTFKPIGFDSPYKKHRQGKNEHTLLRMHVAQEGTEEEIV